MDAFEIIIDNKITSSQLYNTVVQSGILGLTNLLPGCKNITYREMFKRIWQFKENKSKKVL